MMPFLKALSWRRLVFFFPRLRGKWLSAARPMGGNSPLRPGTRPGHLPRERGRNWRMRFEGFSPLTVIPDLIRDLREARVNFSEIPHRGFALCGMTVKRASS